MFIELFWMTDSSSEDPAAAGETGLEAVSSELHSG